MKMARVTLSIIGCATSEDSRKTQSTPLPHPLQSIRTNTIWKQRHVLKMVEHAFNHSPMLIEILLRHIRDVRYSKIRMIYLKLRT